MEELTTLLNQGDPFLRKKSSFVFRNCNKLGNLVRLRLWGSTLKCNTHPEFKAQLNFSQLWKKEIDH